MTDMTDVNVPPKKLRAKPAGPKRINLALQGGCSKTTAWRSKASAAPAPAP